VKTRLLMLVLAVAAPGLAPAQSLPAWVVPVLRLVSETHVQPTTGIVLPGGERVLVSAGFAAPGDEIVVLDGGTDIVRNGRPAQLERAFPELGLEVLAVPGLARRGAPLAADVPAPDSAVRLEAFPPAEQIAEGQPPVDWRGRIGSPGQAGAAVFAAGPPRPNVTGPLLDNCDNLVGISLAEGVPSLEPAAGTAYRWRSELAILWETLQLPVTGTVCGAVTAEPPVAEPEPEPQPTPEPAPPPAEEPPAAEEAAAAEPPDALAAEEEDAAREPMPAELPPVEPADDPPVEATHRGPGWWWLVAAALLFAGGYGVHRLRRGPMSEAATGAETALVDDDARVAPAPGAGEPAADGAHDSWLVLRGRYADGRALEVRAAVSAAAVNLEIGRGGADLAIDSVAVSRRHARLNGTADTLTLTDLGSSNGSSIDGVPCLEGEVLYVEPGATVVLGDVRFTIAIEPGSDRGEAS